MSTETSGVPFAVAIPLIAMGIVGTLIILTAIIALWGSPRDADQTDSSSGTASFAFNILTWEVGILLTILIGWGLAETLFKVISLLQQEKPSSGNLSIFDSTLNEAVSILSYVGWGIGLFASAAFVGYAGFTRINPVHRAYIEILARRLSNPILGEGWVWTFPYITKVASFSTKNMRIDLEEKGVKEISINTRDGISMTISGSALVRVIDPFRASANGTSSEEVARNFGDTFEKAVRAETTRFTSEDLPNVKDDIANTLRSPENYEGDLRQHLANRAREVFGLQLLEVAITGIDFPKTVRDAREEEAKEVAQKRARTTEFDGILERAQRLVIESGGTMSLKEAYNRVLVTEGDKGNNVKIFEGLDGGRAPIILDMDAKS